ncbi:hypothetical protein EDL81_04590 [Ehrlichia ruminantium]|nr:hypothetical protein EDL81_04590 [Ehrlichia ruminantium]
MGLYMLFSADKEKKKQNNNNEGNGDQRDVQERGACGASDESDNKDQTGNTGIEDSTPTSDVTGAEGGTEVSNVDVAAIQPGGAVEDVYIRQGARPKTKRKTKNVEPVSRSKTSPVVGGVHITQGARPKTKQRAEGKEYVILRISKDETRLPIECPITQDQDLPVGKMTSELEKLDIAGSISSTKRSPSIVVQDAFIPQDPSRVNPEFLPSITHDISGYFFKKKHVLAGLMRMQRKYVCSILKELFIVQDGKLCLKDEAYCVLSLCTSCPGIIQPFVNNIIMSMLLNSFNYANAARCVILYRMSSIDFKAVEDTLRQSHAIVSSSLLSCSLDLETMFCHFPRHIPGEMRIPYGVNYYKAILELLCNLIRVKLGDQSLNINTKVKTLVESMILGIIMQFSELARHVRLPHSTYHQRRLIAQTNLVKYALAYMGYLKIHEVVRIGNIKLTRALMQCCSPEFILKVANLSVVETVTFGMFVENMVDELLMCTSNDAINVFSFMVEEYEKLLATQSELFVEGGDIEESEAVPEQRGDGQGYHR